MRDPKSRYAVAIAGVVLFSALTACNRSSPGDGGSSPSPVPSVTAAPTVVTPSPTPTSTPPPTPQPTPTPLPPGMFAATVAAQSGAVIRSGPGSDMAVVGQDPAGTREVFDGWYRRGDDPPVVDFQSGRLETWSQDWYRLAGARGWMHSSSLRGFPPAGMAQVAWSPPQVRDVPIPPAATHRIVISILRQHLWAFDGTQLVFDTVIGTGRPELPTLLGTYHVFYKTSPYEMVSPWPYGSPYWYASAWVQDVMEFIPDGYFIHDAPWRTRWGPGANLVAGSHGCVNVPMPVMAALYRWTSLGDEVVVQQP